MNLTQFVNSLMREAREFETFWAYKSHKEPDKFSLEMSESLWIQYFEEYANYGGDEQDV